MKSSFCIDLQRFMLIPTKFPLSLDVSAVSDGTTISFAHYVELDNNSLVIKK